MTGSNLT